MPRPPKMIPTLVRLPKRMHEALYKRAVAQETSVAEVVRQAITKDLESDDRTD